MRNMTTGWRMQKITRATPNLTSQDQRFVREENSRLAAFCKDRHFPHPRFAIATNLRMHALDFVQFFLISAPTHTQTHITWQTPKQAPQENKSKISKSYEISFFFYGIIPIQVRKAIPFNTTKYTLCLAYQFSIFSQCVFQSCTLKISLNVMNPTIQKPILWNLTLCDLGCGCSGSTGIVIFEANIF